MRRNLAIAVALLALLAAGCNSVPPTNVHQPMTARPNPRADNPYANGAIFNAATSRPLFEDRRARFVGDTLTVSIVENTSASTKSNSKAERESSLKASVGPLSGVPGKTFQGLSATASDTNNFSGKGEAAANNVFTGSITVTVIEVLANGNLLVSGEKQVAIGHGQEYIRLSGVVNPANISGTNSVESSRIADARIEYKESGYISEAQVMGWLARFFLTFLPF